MKHSDTLAKLHAGMHKLFADSQDKIEKALGLDKQPEQPEPQQQPKQAAQGLGQYLESIRATVIAAAAAEVWESGTEREGEGMCEYIANDILAAVLRAKPGLRGKVVHGNDHSWAVIADRKEAYKIDIPWAHYQAKDPGWSPGWAGWQQKNMGEGAEPWIKLIEIAPTERTRGCIGGSDESTNRVHPRTIPRHD